MTVGELKQLLVDVPDDTEILTDDTDHNYRLAHVQVTTALRSYQRGSGTVWTEDHGEKLTPEATYGKRVKAIVIE